MTKLICPCKGCSDRHTWCHNNCERYKSWIDEYHSRKEHIKEQRKKLYPKPTAGERRGRWLSKRKEI